MDKAIQSFYKELLREAHQWRVPISILSNLNKKMGKEDSSKIIVLLIRAIEKAILKNAQGRDRESALASMARKRARLSELQREITHKEGK